MASVFAFPSHPYDEVDVRFLIPMRDTGLSLNDQNLFAGDGQMVGSLEKLAQQFTLRLLTPRGMQAYEPGEGTQFMLDVLAGRLKTAAQVKQSFAIARDEILSQFAADVMKWDNIPSDERLANIELISVVVDRGSIHMQVRLTSVAGLSTSTNIPITFV